MTSRPHVGALPGLDRFGKLSAIEVFEACGDRQAGPALVGLLSDADTTVREWAAKALGALGYTEAGPAIARLNARLLRELVRPDFTEPVVVRSVLTIFGLRRLIAKIVWIDEGDVAVPPPAAGPVSPRI